MRTSALLIAIGFLSFWATTSVSKVFAGTYSGTITAYAQGNLYNAYGDTIWITDAVNHDSDDCPSDPAAYWHFGEYVIFDNYIVMYDGGGNPFDRGTLEAWLTPMYQQVHTTLLTLGRLLAALVALLAMSSLII